MLEELQRRNYSATTIRQYLNVAADFAKHFGKSLDKLGPEHLRSYQAHLLRDRKLVVSTAVVRVAALRFLYVRTAGVYSLALIGNAPAHNLRVMC